MDFQREAFIEEAGELIEELENRLLELEETPEDKEKIAGVFRTLHTIKGSGAMFGFSNIADFTHNVEAVFDKVREGNIKVTQELINLTLAAKDEIKAMLTASDDEKEPRSDTAHEIIQSLSTLFNPSAKSDTASSTAAGLSKNQDETSPVALEPPEEIANEVTYRIRFHPDKSMPQTGLDPLVVIDDLRAMGECDIIAYTDDIPPLTDINPELCYTSWDILLTTNRTLNSIKDVFIFIEGSCELSIDIIEQEHAGEDATDKKIGEILIDRNDLTPNDINQALDVQKPIGKILVEKGSIKPASVEAALVEQQHLKTNRLKHRKATEVSSIRVQADKLDSLVDLVGELVTVQARLSQKATKQNEPELIAIAEEFERLVSGLRDNTMSIRMLQIGTTFSNFKRLVRDLSQGLGKDIVMTTEGGETELDKTVIEQLNDPLIHIIRNSIDHGIELPHDRQKIGKPSKGTIHLSAEPSGAFVLIRISDDGAGLDPVRIRKKALEKGLITPDAIYSDKELYHLIFEPGFSTAQQVTDVSGRGVGMDVVKRNIESLRGAIEIESEIKKGTIITLKLPLTLAIIDGLMVMIGDNYFILPLATVEECVELTRTETDKVRGRNILNVRGEAIPYVRLRDNFEIFENPPALEHVVITEAKGQRIGFVVDHVIGGHQTVIKTLGPAFKHSQDISGATILGDGTVALILDVNKLV